MNKRVCSWKSVVLIIRTLKSNLLALRLLLKNKRKTISTFVKIVLTKERDIDDIIVNFLKCNRRLNVSLIVWLKEKLTDTW